MTESTRPICYFFRHPNFLEPCSALFFAECCLPLLRQKWGAGRYSTQLFVFCFFSLHISLVLLLIWISFLTFWPVPVCVNKPFTVAVIPCTVEVYWSMVIKIVTAILTPHFAITPLDLFFLDQGMLWYDVCLFFVIPFVPQSPQFWYKGRSSCLGCRLKISRTSPPKKPCMTFSVQFMQALIALLSSRPNCFFMRSSCLWSTRKLLFINFSFVIVCYLLIVGSQRQHSTRLLSRAYRKRKPTVQYKPRSTIGEKQQSE